MVINLAVNLDGYNHVTCALAAWLRPAFVCGGSYANNLRTILPWGDNPQQRFLAGQIGTAGVPPPLSGCFFE